MTDGWQPIDTAPRDGTHFLGFGQSEYHLTYWDDSSTPPWRYNYGDIEMWWYPSHWMRLPDPPEVEP